MARVSGPAQPRNRALAALSLRMFSMLSMRSAVNIVKWCEPLVLPGLCDLERGGLAPRGPVLQALEMRARTLLELDRIAPGTLSESERLALDSVMASRWTDPEVDESMLRRERRLAQVSVALQMLLQLDKSAVDQLVDHLAGVARFFEPDVRIALRWVAASEGLTLREVRENALRYGFGLALATTLFRRHLMVVAPGDVPSTPWHPSMTGRELYRRVLARGVRHAGEWLLSEKRLNDDGDVDDLRELLVEQGDEEAALLDVKNTAADQDRQVQRALDRLTPGERAYALHVLAEPGLSDREREQALNKRPGYSKVLRANILAKLSAG